MFTSVVKKTTAGRIRKVSMKFYGAGLFLGAVDRTSELNMKSELLPANLSIRMKIPVRKLKILWLLGISRISTVKLTRSVTFALISP